MPNEVFTQKSSVMAVKQRNKENRSQLALWVGPVILVFFLIASAIVTAKLGLSTILTNTINAVREHAHLCERAVQHVVYYVIAIMFNVPGASFVILIFNGLFFGTAWGFIVNLASEVTALVLVIASVERFGLAEDLREAWPAFEKFMKRMDRSGWQVVLMLPFAKGIPVYYVIALLRMSKRKAVYLCLPAFAVIALVCAYWGDGSFHLLEAAKDGKDAVIKEVILPFEYGSLVVLVLAVAYLGWIMYGEGSGEEQETLKKKDDGEGLEKEEETPVKQDSQSAV